MQLMPAWYHPHVFTWTTSLGMVTVKLSLDLQIAPDQQQAAGILDNCHTFPTAKHFSLPHFSPALSLTSCLEAMESQQLLQRFELQPHNQTEAHSITELVLKPSGVCCASCLHHLPVLPDEDLDKKRLGSGDTADIHAVPMCAHQDSTSTVLLL